jgi:hypothetical protein
MDEIRNAYKILVEILEDIIKMDSKNLMARTGFIWPSGWLL